MLDGIQTEAIGIQFSEDPVSPFFQILPSIIHIHVDIGIAEVIIVPVFP